MPSVGPPFAAVSGTPGQSPPKPAALQRMLALSPTTAGALHDLAALALLADDPARAVRVILRALAADAAAPAARRLYALGLLRLADVRRFHTWIGPRPWQQASEKSHIGELRAAERLLGDLALCAPEDPGLHLSLGAANQAHGCHGAALKSYRRAVALAPAYLEALNNLGTVLADRLERPGGEIWLMRGLAVTPNYAEGWNNLASLRLHDGRPGLAAIAARRALDRRPGWPEPTWNLALAQLSIGDLAGGFAFYESRFDLSETGIAPAIARRWSGPSLPSGPEIVIRAEQGYGDMLQFARYLQLLSAHGLSAVLECHAALDPLLSRVSGVARTVPIGGPFPAVDAQVALMSLPHLLGTRLETVPAEVPYLAAPPERLGPWNDRLAPFSRPRIGLCWQGNPAFRRDRERSPGFAPLAPLLDRATTPFIGLVRDPTPDARHPNLTHIAPDFSDFADAAACLHHLDLVITSDTALAHLAGALAKPTWLLLHHAPDWRWLEHRTDSPWYPTMRLFRQTSPGNWSAVLLQIDRALKALAS